MKKHPKAINRLIILGVIVFCLASTYFLAGTGGALIAFQVIYGKRFSSLDTLNEETFKIYKSRADYPLLSAPRFCQFESGGNKLVGHYFEVHQDKPTIICAHGLSSLSEGLDSAYQNYFVQQGYNVFAIDLTSSGRSDGKGINGLHQGIDDIVNGVSFFESNLNTNRQPIVLCGHSWGGFACAASISRLENISGVITFSAFDSPNGLMFNYVREKAQFFADLTKPTFTIAAWLRSGENGKISASEAINNQKIASLHFLGEKDETVPKESSLASKVENHENNAKVIYLPETGHRMPWFSPRARWFGEQYESFFSSTPEWDKERYYQNVAKEKTSELDPEVFDEIGLFLDTLFSE